MYFSYAELINYAQSRAWESSPDDSAMPVFAREQDRTFARMRWAHFRGIRRKSPTLIFRRLP